MEGPRGRLNLCNCTTVFAVWGISEEDWMRRYATAECHLCHVSLPKPEMLLKPLTRASTGCKRGGGL